MTSVFSAPPHVAAGIIPCCMPYWDSDAFFKAGGLYSEQHGYHITEAQDPLDFESWLPRRWLLEALEQPGPVLLPDMLPSSVWENNLRTQLTPEEWDRLRKFCYQAAGNRCVACGSPGEPHVEAHEAWRFDPATGKQILRGLLCLCPTCHKAKHMGFAHRLGMVDQVRHRLCWLNRWTSVDMDAAMAAALEQQEKLSQRTWELDLSFLRTYGVR